MIKAITVKEAKKLKPGTWVRVLWDDGVEDAIVTENCFVDGDKEIRFFGTISGNNYIGYDRIISIGGQLDAVFSNLDPIEEYLKYIPD